MAENGNGAFSRWMLALCAALAVAGVGGAVNQYGFGRGLEARVTGLEEHRREQALEIRELRRLLAERCPPVLR